MRYEKNWPLWKNLAREAFNVNFFQFLFHNLTQISFNHCIISFLFETSDFVWFYTTLTQTSQESRIAWLYPLCSLGGVMVRPCCHGYQSWFSVNMNVFGLSDCEIEQGTFLPNMNDLFLVFTMWRPKVVGVRFFLRHSV